MAQLPPLRAYTINLAGSLAGVVALGVISWLELPPAVWFGVAFAAAVPLLLSRRSPATMPTARPSARRVGPRRPFVVRQPRAACGVARAWCT